MEIKQKGKKNSEGKEITDRGKSKVAPACKYKRIRAANIAERTEVFHMLDIDRAVAEE